MTNVEKVKAGELAIFNDNNEAIHKIIKYFNPTVGWLPEYQQDRFFIYDYETSCGFDFKDSTTLPTIPATELLKLLESETVEAWSPKVGEEYEFSNNELVFERGELLGIINHEYKYIVKVLGSNHPIPHINCRPIPTKQLTRKEAEALLSELKGETYKIVD